MSPRLIARTATRWICVRSRTVVTARFRTTPGCDSRIQDHLYRVQGALIRPGLVEGWFSQRRLVLEIDLAVVLVLLVDWCEVCDRWVQPVLVDQCAQESLAGSSSSTVRNGPSIFMRSRPELSSDRLSKTERRCNDRQNSPWNRSGRPYTASSWTALPGTLRRSSGCDLRMDRSVLHARRRQTVLGYLCPIKFEALHTSTEIAA